jgi:hypothetical protein
MTNINQFIFVRVSYYVKTMVIKVPFGLGD